MTFIFRIGSEPGLTELRSAVDRPDNIFTFARYDDMDSRVLDAARQIPFYAGMCSFSLGLFKSYEPFLPGRRAPNRLLIGLKSKFKKKNSNFIL